MNGMEMHKHDGIRYLAPTEPTPVDWPARFRAAADVAAETGADWLLLAIADELRCMRDEVVEDIGRALSGETS